MNHHFFGRQSSLPKIVPKKSRSLDSHSAHRIRRRAHFPIVGRYSSDTNYYTELAHFCHPGMSKEWPSGGRIQKPPPPRGEGVCASIMTLHVRGLDKHCEVIGVMENRPNPFSITPPPPPNRRLDPGDCRFSLFD